MTPAPPPIPPALERSLVANAGFLRGLAARLVADPGTADDVVQETYLAAVRHPPEPREGLRGWLASVARNAARLAGRTSLRRAHRERAAARPEGCPSPEEVLGREEARRRVVDAVLRLEGPFREVILLRYYEGLPPRAAAVRLGIPVETVRTRTRRALERLRADLDRRHGDRRVWATALAPLANAEPPPPSLLVGAAAMSTKGKTLAAILVLALAAGGAWLLLGESLPSPAGSGGEGPVPVAAAPGDPAAPLAGRGVRPPSEPERGEAPPMRAASRSARPLGVLRGVVASGRTHAPVTGATVVARPTGGVVPDGFSADGPPDDRRTGTTDAEGRFVLEGVPAGAWTVAVAHAEEGEASAVGASGPDAAWILLYPMPRVAGADDVVVRVVDAGQRPVAGARVELASDVGGPPRVETADAEGLARFADVPTVGDMAMGWATATGPEGIGRTAWRHARRSRPPDAPPVVVKLAAAGAIEGRLAMPLGESPTGIVVEAWSMTGGGGTWSTGVATTATADAEGRWRVDGLPAGVVALLVSPVRGLRLALSRQEGANVAEGQPEYETVRVTVEAGRTARAELALVRGGRLAGRVVAQASRLPVPGVRVEAHLPQGPWDYSERYRREGVHFWRLDGPWPDARRHPLTFHVLATDADGRYVLDGLLPGPWRVTVAPRGALAFDRREDVPVKDGETTTLDHVLVEGGTLELAAVPFSSLGVRRKGDGAMLATFLTPGGETGAATLPGLPAGTYELVHTHSDPAERPIPVADFEIRPGETTYVDATDRGNHRVAGRLLDRGVPVAGARLRGEDSHGTQRLTDGDGRFAWHLTRWPASTHTQAWVTLGRPGAPTLGARIPLSGQETDLALPTGAVIVRVRDAAGRPVPGTPVTLSSATDPGNAPWRIAGEVVVRAGPDGTATFAPVPPGSYQLVARQEATGAEPRRTVTVEDRPVETTLDAPPTGSVRIRVTDAAGLLRADVPVSVQSLPTAVDPGPSSQDRWRLAENRTQNGMRTGADGTIVVQGLAAGLVRVGAWVMAEGGWMAKENAQAELAVEPDREVEAVLTLRPVAGR